MESIVKHAREVGTSAGVLLPRKWLNKQVVVTLFPPKKEDIAKKIIEIIFRHNLDDEVKGIYLFGSYARGDYDFDSDIDVLVITKDEGKLINDDGYEILLIPEKKFSENVKKRLYFLSILKELKVILNKELIEKYTTKEYKFNARDDLAEINRMVKINKDSVQTYREFGDNVPDGIIYSLVLRLRELYLIKCIREGKQYSKKRFLDTVGEKIHSAYARVKRDQQEIDNISPDEAEPIIELSEKWLKELKGRKSQSKA